MAERPYIVGNWKMNGTRAMLSQARAIDRAAQNLMKVEVALDAKKRPQEHTYESSIKLNIESKAKNTGDVLFLMEIEYVGIFHIEGVPEEQMHPFLLIECPRMVFPFLRRVVSDVTSDGGFPPLNLDNMDFVGIYRAEVARRQAAQAAAGGEPAKA